MDPIKSKTQIILLVEARELERFAQEAYKLNGYSFAGVQECDNHSDHAFSVDGAVDEDDDEEDIKLIKDGVKVPMWRNNLLLNVLCKDGYIAPGNYLIEVNW